MKYYFICLNLSVLLFVGCSTGFPTVLLPEGGDGTPYQHDSRSQLAASHGFWDKTKQFFAPDLDEESLPERTSHKNPQRQLVQRSEKSPIKQENQTTESSVLLEPSAYALRSQTTAFDPMRQYPLYSAFQFETPAQNVQADYHTVARLNNDLASFSDEKIAEESIDNKAESENQKNLFAGSFQTNREDGEIKNSSESVESLLQARSGDSREFKRLLFDIKETPEEDWKIDKEELSIRLANFRNSMKAEKDTELESLYLENLRSGILSPSTGLTAKKNNPLRNKKSNKTEFDEELADLDETPDDCEDSDDLRKPLKIASGKTGASRLPTASEQSTLARSAPQPPRSKYGQLTQINDQGIMPVGYQPQVLPPGGAVVPANYQYPMPQDGGYGSVMPGAAPNYPNYYQQNGSWAAQARVAADMLRREIEQTPAGRTFENEVRLRLLELALGNRSEAVRPFTTEEKLFSEAWNNLALGVSTLYDNGVIPDRRERIVSAAFRFDEASFGMNKFCPIRLKNVQFVKDWQAFGVFLPRDGDCRAGEEIGVYLELENPSIRTTAHGFNVSASIRYEILDKTANVVEKSEKIPVEETTPSQKRDYCIHLPVFLPRSLDPGQYQLRINVTDMNSEKLQYAEEQIPIRILPALTSAGPQNR